MSSSAIAPTGLVDGSTSVPHSTESTRRRLSDRQALTVQKLVVAAVEELREQGYDGLTVRNVARRAGVAPATAYNYFTSREHLVTEVFWRRLRGLAESRVDMRRNAAARAVATMTESGAARGERAGAGLGVHRGDVVERPGRQAAAGPHRSRVASATGRRRSVSRPTRRCWARSSSRCRVRWSRPAWDT